MILKLGVITFLTIISSTTIDCRDVLHGQPEDPVSLVVPSLERVLKALEKLLVFYKRQYKNLIIDGVYGLRMLQGVVNVILQENKIGLLQIPIKKQKRILKLAVVASSIARKTYPYLKKFDENYFEMMGFTVMKPWENIQPFKKLKLPHSDNPTSASDDEYEMEEGKQDRCFNALVGDTKKGIKPCSISDFCWKVNTKPNQKSYTLTHQLLYLLLGQVKGCSKVFDSRFKADAYDGGIERFLSTSCHAMYPEMIDQEKIAIKKKTLGEIDLYMEQGVICGMIGFTDFFSLERLNRILGWRHKDGCFGFTDDIGGKEDEDSYGDQEGMTTMRKLTVTRDLEGGCEVHATGVGTGLLALYLRWLLHLSFRQPTTSQDAVQHHHSHNSDNLIAFLLIAAVITIFMVFSKKFGLRFHRNRLIRNICPCI